MADLFSIVSAETSISLGDGSEQSQRIKLGKMLADRHDRVFQIEIGDSCVQLSLQRAAKHQGACRWKLQPKNEG